MLQQEVYDTKNRLLGLYDSEDENEDSSICMYTMEYSEMLSRLKCVLKYNKVDGLDAIALQGAIYLLEDEVEKEQK